MIKIGSEENFENLVAKDVTLVDFFATWCGPCKMLGPVLEEVAESRSDVQVVKIDVDQSPNLAKTYGIMSVPTMLLFKDGKMIAKKTGFMPKELVEEWIQENTL